MSSSRKRWPIYLVLSVFVMVGGGLVVVFRSEGSVSSLSVVVPRHFDQSSPAFRAYVSRYIEEVRSDSGSASRHALLGVVYEANSMWSEARACYRNAVRLDPNFLLAQYHLAVTSIQLGDTKEALKLLQSVGRQHPDFAPALYRLGEVLLDAGDITEAEKAFRKVLFVRPDALAAKAGLATARLRLHDYAGGVKRLEPLLKTNPNIRLLHYLLGQAYQSLGRREEAKREIKEGANAEKLFLTDEWTRTFSQYTQRYLLKDRMRQAQVFFETGQVAQAAELLERTRLDHPDNVAVLNNLATAYLMGNKPGKALKPLRHAATVDAGHFVTFSNLAKAYLLLGKRTDALDAIDRSIVLAPRVARSQHLHARILVELKRYREAVPSMQKAVELDPKNPGYHLDYGMLCLVQEHIPEATQQYEKALQLDPSFWKAHLSLADLCMRQGRTDEAQGHLKAAQRLVPSEPLVRQIAERLRQRETSQD